MSVNKTRDLTFSFPDMESERRLAELALYIAQQCLDDPRFGAVKLNRLIFFADALSYRHSGKPVTGSEYIRLAEGPAPQRMAAILRALADAGRLAMIKRRVHDFEEYRVVALTEPDLDLFRAQDIALVDELIRVHWGKTAGEISMDGTVWEAAVYRGLIPYEAMLLSGEGVTEADIARAQELIQQHGWAV